MDLNADFKKEENIYLNQQSEFQTLKNQLNQQIAEVNKNSLMINFLINVSFDLVNFQNYYRNTV